jgi:hypothetical protein
MRLGNRRYAHIVDLSPCEDIAHLDDKVIVGMGGRGQVVAEKFAANGIGYMQVVLSCAVLHAQAFGNSSSSLEGARHDRSDVGF